jgi:hypothetical protein
MSPTVTRDYHNDFLNISRKNYSRMSPTVTRDYHNDFLNTVFNIQLSYIYTCIFMERFLNLIHIIFRDILLLF